MARKATRSKARRPASQTKPQTKSTAAPRDRIVAAFMAMLGELPIERIGLAEIADRAGAILAAAGYDASVIERVGQLLQKKHLRSDPEAQTLEDAACLVFLESEIGAFAAAHSTYPREKFIAILRKTWRKMSPAAREAALGLDLPGAIAELVRAATAE